MHFTIYRITNKLNFKTYIGKHQTINLDDGYMGSGKYLKRAITKYGLENFSKEIIYIFETEEEMNAKERELVTEEFCARGDTYNICEGGKGGFIYIHKNRLWDTPQRFSAAQRNITKAKDGYLKYFKENAKEHSRKVSIGLKEYFRENPRSGVMHTEQSKKKIGIANSISQAGPKNSQFGSMWITDGCINKKINKLDDIPEGWYKGRHILS